MPVGPVLLAKQSPAKQTPAPREQVAHLSVGEAFGAGLDAPGKAIIALGSSAVAAELLGAHLFDLHRARLGAP